VSRVRAAVRVEATIAQAEALWYDLGRWSGFVDGFSHVARVDAQWPRAGSLTWDARPGGRERVLEEVVWFSPREGQDARVEDPQLIGVQRVRFLPGAVTLELEYRLKERSRLVDLLVVRRRVREAMARTLRRMAIELRAEAQLRRDAG
jgi:hypothetical protein